MQALVAYDEDSGSDSGLHRSPSATSRRKDDTAWKSNGKGKGKNDDNHNVKLSASMDNATEATLPKLKRSPPSTKNASPSGSIQFHRRPSQTQARLHLRAHSPPPNKGPSPSSEASGGLLSQVDREVMPTIQGQPEDELTRIRVLLRPPPVPGREDWDIPPPSSAPCEPELEAKLQQFFDLKRSNPPKHFNDSLMSNRTFRNPHLYAKLVEFVDVDEKSSNIPKGCWDMDDLDGWNAEKLASAQKLRSEQQATAQAPGKRNQIAFATSSSAPRSSQSRPSTTDAMPRRDVKERRDGRKYDPYDLGAPRKSRPGSRWG